MTPTLFGRWQTRLVLMGTVGAMVTLMFGYGLGDYLTPFAILGYVTLLGFIWDIIYNHYQLRRWDQDWPPIYQLVNGIGEGILIGLLVIVWPRFFSISLPFISSDLAVTTFTLHYSSVWAMTFVMTQGPLRVLFPNWRFFGGQIL